MDKTAVFVGLGIVVLAIGAFGVGSAVALSTDGGAADTQFAASAPGQAQQGQSSTEPNIEFINCTAARITGDFDRIGLDAVLNRNGGIDDVYEEIPREDFSEVPNITVQPDGSVIVESIFTGINGTFLNSVTAFGDRERLASEQNDDEQCYRQLRPRLDVSLVDVTQTAPDTYSVTFGYTNDHDIKLRVLDEELRGQVDDNGEQGAPSELLPGRNTFSVEWTPANGAERLTWQVGLNSSFVGVDQAVTVQTAPASAYQTPSDPFVEYVNCTAARITGDFDRVSFEALFNVNSGVDEGSTILPLEPDGDLPRNPDGSVTVRSIWSGINGTVLTEVRVLDESGGEVASLGIEEQDEQCIRQVRPDVNVSVASVRPVSEDTFDVTFAYMNNHTENLSVFRGELRGQVSGDDEAPQRLRPGRNTFSVEWTPANGFERLTWQAGFNGSWVGVDQPVTAQTAPASEFRSGDGFESRTLRIEAPPDADVFSYTLRVAGDAELGSAANPGTEDSVTNNGDGTVTIRGTVGLGGGDTYEILGPVVCGSLDGPGEILIDGQPQQIQDCDSPGVDQTLRIEAPPDAEVFSYTVRVDGDAELGSAANPETADSVTDNDDGTVTVQGTVGLGSGDSYEFSGDIVCGSLDGPGDVLVDGQPRQIQPCDTGDDDDDDDDSGGAEQTLRIEAPANAEVFSYTIRVDGDAELGSAANPATEDSVTGNSDGTATIRGTVGLGSGDSYEFTGDLVCGSLDGPGDVLVDGQPRQIQPCDTGGDDDDDGSDGADQTLRIEAPSDAEVFSYTVRVDGDAELGPAANPATEDSVTNNGDGTVTIRGTVGLGSGDSYEFSGNIICASLGGPGETLVDGARRSLDSCSDSPSGPPSETLRINSDPDAEVFSYTIRVDGDAELGSAANPETEDSVTNNGDGTVTIFGTVGLGGGDTYEISGDVVCGSLAGPGEVLLDGRSLQLETCG